MKEMIQGKNKLRNCAKSHLSPPRVAVCCLLSAVWLDPVLVAWLVFTEQIKFCFPKNRAVDRATTRGISSSTNSAAAFLL
jgi:hypothetical protein